MQRFKTHLLAILALAAAGTAVAATAAAAPVFSSKERAEGLLEGRGMGLAVAAENHGYPGPRHALDAADKLGLSAEQRTQISGLVDQMRTEAIPAAKRLLADEDALDRLFIDRKATLASITEASARAGRSEAAARVVHLKYHLAMVKILTPKQVADYEALGSHVEPAAPASDADAHHHH
jgi:Spy/CpxP family protein refolding chaperone